MIGRGPMRADHLMLHEASAPSACGKFSGRHRRGDRAGVFVYSRAGYGKSKPGRCRAQSRSCTRKPALCCRACSTPSASSAACCSHSDGASIATIYAAACRIIVFVDCADGPAFFHRGHGIAEIECAAMRSMPARCAKKLKRCTPTLIARSLVERPWLHPDFPQVDITEALGYIRCRSWSCKAPTINTHTQAGSKRRNRNASVR